MRCRFLRSENTTTTTEPPFSHEPRKTVSISRDRSVIVVCVRPRPKPRWSFQGQVEESIFGPVPPRASRSGGGDSPRSRIHPLTAFAASSQPDGPGKHEGRVRERVTVMHLHVLDLHRRRVKQIARPKHVPDSLSTLMNPSSSWERGCASSDSLRKYCGAQTQRTLRTRDGCHAHAMSQEHTPVSA